MATKSTKKRCNPKGVFSVLRSQQEKNQRLQADVFLIFVPKTKKSYGTSLRSFGRLFVVTLFGLLAGRISLEGLEVAGGLVVGGGFWVEVASG